LLVFGLAMILLARRGLSRGFKLDREHPAKTKH
jgi:hypothetical protein